VAVELRSWQIVSTDGSLLRAAMDRLRAPKPPPRLRGKVPRRQPPPIRSKGSRLNCPRIQTWMHHIKEANRGRLTQVQQGVLGVPDIDSRVIPDPRPDNVVRIQTVCFEAFSPVALPLFVLMVSPTLSRDGG
jgi:hypothetical protein